jgi:hypothetical protein
MYSLSGTGSLGIYGNVYVGGSSTGTGGIGAFAMSGGTMSATGGITVFSGCNFAQTGGSVTAGSLTINSGGSLNLSGGTLSSSVIVAGKLTTTGSPTAISISGPFTLQSTATTLAQLLGSTPAFGAISSTGNMTLAGSLALYVDAANEATTTAGQSFIILQATGSGVLSGAFSNIASGQTLTTADGTASFVVTINEGTDGDVVLSDFQMVPEPGMASVMGAVAAMGMMRRRRRELKVKNLEDDHLLGGDGVGDHCSFLDDGKRMGMGAVRERYPYHEAAAAGGGLTFRRTAARRPPSGESISI